MDAKKNIIFLITLIFLLPEISYTHHAKEYLQTESYAQAPKGGIIFFNGFDYFRPSLKNSDLNEWEYTPLLTYGISNRLMMNVHTHLLNINGHDPFFEAFVFGLQYQVTKPGTQIFDVGLSVEYEFPLQKSRDLINGKEIFQSTLILSKELPNDINITSNISYLKETKYGHDDELSIATAIKGHVFPSYEWLESGFEFLALIGHETSYVAVPGIYFTFTEKLILKTGASIGLNSTSEDFGFHMVFAYNF